MFSNIPSTGGNLHQINEVVLRHSDSDLVSFSNYHLPHDCQQQLSLRFNFNLVVSGSMLFLLVPVCQLFLLQ